MSDLWQIPPHSGWGCPGLASNIVVDLALVPEKMEQTQAFEDITEDSYEALVQTDDIEQNRMSSLEKTNRWAETAVCDNCGWLSAEGNGLLPGE